MKNLNLHKIVYLAALALPACGLNNPSYEAYESPAQEEGAKDEAAGDAAGEGGPMTCPDSAVAVFGEMVAPAIATACSNCHNDGHKMPLPLGQNADNRGKLLKFAGLNAAKLADFISSKPPHGGGDQSGTLPATKIEFWIDAEKACAGNK